MGWNGTRTWAVGDPALSSDMNLYVRDNLAFLAGDLTPTALVLAAGWANNGSGYAAAQIERHGSIAQVSGLITATAAKASGAVIADVGPYAPLAYHVLSGVYNAGAADQLARFLVLTAATGGHLETLTAIPSGAVVSITSTYSLIAT